MSVKAAIVDYGICNMFSVKHACETVGVSADITSDSAKILASDVVILPGVGAFGDAMASLKKLNLIEPIKEAAQSGKPVVGICLGMQLFMTESSEFGNHKGLDLIPGKVIRFESKAGKSIKVPHVGWNKIHQKKNWSQTPLHQIQNGSYVYFVHSYYVVPKNDNCILTVTDYEGIEFCSSIKHNNLYAFQFHPERSGRVGIQIYKNILSFVKQTSSRCELSVSGAE